MGQGSPTDNSGEPPLDHVKVYLGLMKKGPLWSADSTPEVETNQRRHLALLSRLYQSGELLLAGPTPSESDLRGILIIKAESEAAARVLFEEDAHLTSDRLVLEIHPLYLSLARLQNPLLGANGLG